MKWIIEWIFYKKIKKDRDRCIFFSLFAVMKLYVQKRIAWYETTKSDKNLLDTKNDECL